YFIIQQYGDVSNLQIAASTRTPSSSYDSKGRKTGYFVIYVHRVGQTAMPTGFFSVYNEVDAYRGATGAHWGYGVATHMAPRTGMTPHLKIPKIGDESSGYSMSELHHPQERIALIWFRRNGYVVQLQVLVVGTNAE